MARNPISTTLWGVALFMLTVPFAASKSKPLSPTPSPVDLGAAEPRIGVVDAYTLDTARLAAQASAGEPFEENTEAMEAERETIVARGVEHHTQNACH